MIQARKLGGIIVPLVTPFDERGDLAAKKARTLIERYLDIGVHGFYVGGTSGEGFFQSIDERCEFLRVVAEVVSGCSKPLRCHFINPTFLLLSY